MTCEELLEARVPRLAAVPAAVLPIAIPVVIRGLTWIAGTVAGGWLLGRVADIFKSADAGTMSTADAQKSVAGVLDTATKARAAGQLTQEDLATIVAAAKATAQSTPRDTDFGDIFKKYGPTILVGIITTMLATRLIRSL